MKLSTKLQAYLQEEMGHMLPQLERLGPLEWRVDGEYLPSRLKETRATLSAWLRPGDKNQGTLYYSVHIHVEEEGELTIPETRAVCHVLGLDPDMVEDEKRPFYGPYVHMPIPDWVGVEGDGWGIRKYTHFMTREEAARAADEFRVVLDICVGDA